MRRPAPSGHPARPQFGVYGVLGSGNWGNDASADVLVRFILDKFPTWRPTFMAMGHETMIARYGGSGVALQWDEGAGLRRRLPRRLRQVLGRMLDPVCMWSWVGTAGVVFVPGSGMWETTTPLRPWGPHYGMLCLGAAARLRGVPLVYVSGGADTGAQRVLGGMVRWSARLSTYRSYRDELSKAAMRRIGVDVAHDEVYADMVFAMEPPVRRPHAGRVMGLGLMNFRGNSDQWAESSRLHEQYVAGLTTFLRLMVDLGWEVHLLTGDVEDVPIVRAVRAGLRSEADRARVVEQPVSSLTELMDVIAGVDIMVGSRYHNVVCGVLVGVPTVSVSYAPKNDALLTRMGLEAYCHPADDVRPLVLADQVAALMGEADERTEAMAGGIAAARADAARQLDDLADWLSTAANVAGASTSPGRLSSRRRRQAVGSRR